MFLSGRNISKTANETWQKILLVSNGNYTFKTHCHGDFGDVPWSFALRYFFVT